jgi:hypothetical protein
MATDAHTAAVDLLRRRGAAEVEHPGGRLLAHLLRTEATLREWDAPEATCLAGLTHAAYGTDGFPVPLLTLDERDLLIDAVGEDAEAEVHRYASCGRDATYARLGEDPLVLTDRFAGTDVELNTAEAGAFAVLTIVNELDLVRQGAFDDATTAAIGRLFRGLAPYAPDAAATALAEL